MIENSTLKFVISYLGETAVFILLAAAFLLQSLALIPRFRKEQAETRKLELEAEKMAGDLQSKSLESPAGRKSLGGIPLHVLPIVVIVIFGLVVFSAQIILASRAISRLESMSVFARVVTVPYHRSGEIVPMGEQWSDLRGKDNVLGVWYQPAGNIYDWECVDNFDLSVDPAGIIRYTAVGSPSRCINEGKKPPAQVTAKVLVLHMRK